jgi:predicted acetylornithine/succinylornithine family transaminase
MTHAMTQNQLIESAKRSLLATYRQAPIVLTEGKGCRVRDVSGREYLDLCAGIAVVSVGHGHPKLAAAIGAQAARLMHTSNLFYNDRSIELAEELGKRAPFSRYFFCNSGAEANEGLLKLARRYAYDRGQPERIEIITAFSSFHGRTMGAISLTGQTKYQEGIGPLVPGISHVPYGDLAALEAAVGARTAAVFLEVIQGEGGVVAASDAYLRGARELCDKHGALLFYDEVQTCFGRTGKFLAYEHSGVVPDGCSLAKGIASGFPLGAIAVREPLAAALPPGTHATTFGGNPLACAAALAVLSIFDEERLVENAASVGVHLGQALERIAQRGGAAVEARGQGLLRGLRLAPGVDPAATLAKLRDAGVLLSLAGGNVLRFTPPLCVSAQEIDEGVAVVERVLAEPAALAAAR